MSENTYKDMCMDVHVHDHFLPSLRLVTPSPTAMTFPLDSCPITMGSSRTKSPILPALKKCMSDPQIPTDRIAKSTSIKGVCMVCLSVCGGGDEYVSLCGRTFG